MKPSRILVTLATIAGFAGAGFYGTSDANVAPSANSPPPASYVKAAEIIQYGQPNRLNLRSNVAMIVDDREGVMLYGRNVDRPRPIASLTKLMTALIIMESGLSLDESIEITRADRDRLRGTRSRLPFGGVFTRYDLLRTALGASDNRAAAALARTYPGGQAAMVTAMNAKAQELGMTQTRYADATGLNNNNVSTARDLTRLIAETPQHPLFHILTTTATFRIADRVTNREYAFHNTNRLVRNDTWDIALSKTGYTAAAGNCLIMQTTVENRPLTIVLLDSWGKLSRYGDAKRIHQWLQKAERRVPNLTTARATPG
jgi:D-alanyl-D-alanine endopeptidase (penicillin-binding protein 7)